VLIFPSLSTTKPSPAQLLHNPTQFLSFPPSLVIAFFRHCEHRQPERLREWQLNEGDATPTRLRQ
jgi:hypothetical protein